ncbi:MAG: glutaminase A [Hyphomicrobiales bacterium]
MNKKNRMHYNDIGVEQIFDALSVDNDHLLTDDLWKILADNGIQENDPRFLQIREFLCGDNPRHQCASINFDAFNQVISQSNLLRKSLTGQLVVPDFKSFSSSFASIYEQTKKNVGGKVADYIPQLARVNPDYYAVSVCTIDGQRYALGDVSVPFCFQSTCKPILYCMAQEDYGADNVHNHVGYEPSGLGFNELNLDRNQKPHNPMINAGAIMCSSLIKRKLDLPDKFDAVLNTIKDLGATDNINFNNAVYLSERQTADRNFALAYYMRENKAFPPNTDIIEALDFYFQCCSIEVNAVDMSVIGATLANGGINPFTEKKVFANNTVQNCMSLMYSCGMYDYSGEFAFKIGLPAKSGVSGALLVVIPDLMGICIWSPRLDQIGNSVRGIEFCQELANRYNIHKFDALAGETDRRNPKAQKFDDSSKGFLSLIESASRGDLVELKRLMASGVDINAKNYDGRTALHLACAEGQTEVVQFLIENNVEVDIKDRWGHTPLSEAEIGGFLEIVRLLRG